jgi:hypothetical protein
MRRCLSGSTAPSVRMLCSRSASLIRITRTSRAIASSILRKFSACACSRRRNCSLSSLDTPSTSSATGAAEVLDQLLLGDARIFQHVVQQRRHHRRAVEPPVGQDLGDGQRMRDVGRAAGAKLAEVGFVGKAERVLDLLHLGRRQVLLDAVGQRCDGGHTVVRWRPIQNARRPFSALRQRDGQNPAAGPGWREGGGCCGMGYPRR